MGLQPDPTGGVILKQQSATPSKALKITLACPITIYVGQQWWSSTKGSVKLTDPFWISALIDIEGTVELYMDILQLGVGALVLIIVALYCI